MKCIVIDNLYDVKLSLVSSADELSSKQNQTEKVIIVFCNGTVYRLMEKVYTSIDMNVNTYLQIVTSLPNNIIYKHTHWKSYSLNTVM